jgi:hypothetical protein
MNKFVTRTKEKRYRGKQEIASKKIKIILTKEFSSTLFCFVVLSKTKHP